MLFRDAADPLPTLADDCEVVMTLLDELVMLLDVGLAGSAAFSLPIVVHHFRTCLWQRAVGSTVESRACVAQVICLVCTNEVV